MVYFTSEGMCSDIEALLLIRLNHLSPTSAPVCSISNKIFILLFFCCCITFWLLPLLALEIISQLSVMVGFTCRSKTISTEHEGHL